MREVRRRRNRVQGRKKGAVELSLAFRKHGSLKCSVFEHRPRRRRPPRPLRSPTIRRDYNIIPMLGRSFLEEKFRFSGFTRPRPIPSQPIPVASRRVASRHAPRIFRSINSNRKFEPSSPLFLDTSAEYRREGKKQRRKKRRKEGIRSLIPVERNLQNFREGERTADLHDLAFRRYRS